MGRMSLRSLASWACLLACVGCSGGPDPGPAATPGDPPAAAKTGTQTSAKSKAEPEPETEEPPPAPPPRPKSSTPSTAPAPRPPPPKDPPPKEPRSARRPAPEVSDILLRLQSTPEEAGKAYREIWEAPRGLIPKLIPEVANPEPSALRELAVLVLDKDFAQVDSKDGTVAYDIPGMGKVKYDDIVVGKAPRGLKVILRRLDKPFPVGSVVRAGLLNRFRSTEYPGGSDVSDPVGWWQRFYDRVRTKL
jgi:hypothetical protein